MTKYTTLDQFFEEEGIAEEVNANTAKRLAELDAGDALTPARVAEMAAKATPTLDYQGTPTLDRTG